MNLNTNQSSADQISSILLILPKVLPASLLAICSCTRALFNLFKETGLPDKRADGVIIAELFRIVILCMVSYNHSTMKHNYDRHIEIVEL